MKNKTQGPVISDARLEEAMLGDSVPAQDTIGTESAKSRLSARLKTMFSSLRASLIGDASDLGYAARIHAVRTTVKRCLSVLAVFFLSLFFLAQFLPTKRVRWDWHLSVRREHRLPYVHPHSVFCVPAGKHRRCISAV